MIDYKTPPKRGSSTGLERRKFWEKAVADQESSKLSVSKFCSQHQLNSVNFRYWRRRLNKNESPTFLPVQVTQTDLSEPRKLELEISLECRNGYCLRISNIRSKESFQQIVSLTEELPC